jgi:hypothetical protein
MHADTPEQDTVNSCPVGASGLGLGTLDQPDPNAPAGVASATARIAAPSSANDRFMIAPRGR